MSTERESLPELQNKAERLSSLIDRRRELYTQWTSKEDRFDPSSVSAEIALRRLRRHAVMEDKISSSELELASFHEQIKVLEDEPRLITRAEEWRSEVTKRKAQREEFVRFSAEGRLSAALTHRWEATLFTLLNQQDGDPELKRGLELLEEREKREAQEVAPAKPEQPSIVSVEHDFEIHGRLVTSIDESKFIEPTQEVKKLPIAKVNRKDKTTELNGIEDDFSDMQWDTLMIIIKAGKEGILTKDLEKTVRERYPQSRSTMGEIIHPLRYKLELDSANPKIITTTGSARGARYFFNAEIQYAPSQLVIFEGRNRIFIDNREIELTSEEMVLLKVLVDKVGEVVNSRTISTQALGIEDPVASRLRFKMADLAKKINYPYGDKLIDSRMAGMNSGYKLQNVELATEEETKFYAGQLKIREILTGEKEKAHEETPAEESVEEKQAKVLVNVAEIQRLIDSGIPTSPEALAKAQEMAKQVGGSIEFNIPISEPESLGKLIASIDESEFEEEGEGRSKLTPELAVALVGLIQHKSREGIIIKIGERNIKFGLNDSTSKILDDIVDRYVPKDQELNGQYSKLRAQALDVVERIINDENRDSLIEAYEDRDIKFLLTYFCIPDNPEMEKFLIEFLRAEDPSSIPVLDKQMWVDRIRTETWRPEGTVRSSVQHFVSEAMLTGTPESGEAKAKEAKTKRERKIEEEAFELPNKRTFVLKATRSTLDTFKFILEGHNNKTLVEIGDLAEIIYDEEINDVNNALDLQGAKDRISANIISLNRLLEKDKAGYIIKNLTSRSDANRKVPSRFDLLETEKPADEIMEGTGVAVEVDEGQEDNGRTSDVGHATETLTFRRLSAEELAGSDTEKETKASKPRKAGKPSRRIMDSRELIQYAESRGLRVTNGGGDLKIVDSDGNYVASIPGHHGGRDLKRGTYRAIIKKINERSTEKEDK